MDKLILLSVIFATVAIPALTARDPNPRRGMRRTLFWMMTFNIAYYIAVLYIYPQVL